MSAIGIKPLVVSESDVELVGPGHDDNHYISVPIKELFAIENVGDIGVCYMEPGDETCVFAIEEGLDVQVQTTIVGGHVFHDRTH